jgi:hypothetical protein
MNRKLMAACALLLTVGMARAALVELDYQASGDKKITFDTASGLQWLDFSVTVNYSVDGLAAGAGGFYSQGWRHATQEEADALYADAGITPYTVDANSLALRDLLGATGANPWDSDNAVGILGTGHAVILSDTYTGPTFGNWYGTSYADAGVGNALVRSVPEPSTAAALGAGLAGVVLLRRRRAA